MKQRLNWQVCATFVLLICTFLSVQAQPIRLEPANLELGNIEKAGSVKARMLLRNTSTKTLVLLKADVPRNYTVVANRKVIPARDTTELVIEYHPTQAGPFRTTVKLTHNQSAVPFEFGIGGNIQNLLADQLTNCVDFSPKKEGPESASIPLITNHVAFFTDSKTGKPIREAAILYISHSGREKMERSTTNGRLNTPIPIGPYALVVSSPGYETLMAEQYIQLNATSQNFVLTPAQKTPEKAADTVVQAPPPPPPTNKFLGSGSGLLDETEFKPNNIVFLIDVSGSMKEPEKLPLLKKSIATLLKPIRSSDKITIITYAETVQVVVPVTAGSNKERILEAVDSLKAGGVTAGSAGLKKAYEMAFEAFIAGGNNQVILATDGVFRISGKDRKMIEKSALDEKNKLVLSVAGFGDQESALDMLKGLSDLGKGSFIHIRNERESVNALLEEIKGRSRR